jgi:WD40 repeat protein
LFTLCSFILYSTNADKPILFAEEIKVGLLEIYHGRETWTDYLSSQPQSELDETRSESSIGINISASDYRLALESGLGAVRATIGEGTQRIDLSRSRLAGGLDQVNADFTPALGDILWKLEIHESALGNILDEIRLAEFEREARAYRRRGERAYLHGWYEEALGDFLEAAKRDYPDFTVHRSIANIYLYHIVDLPRALESFCKAAKYAKASDNRQAAEAHYFAGIVSFMQRQLNDAFLHLQEAVRLNGELFEAHYQLASVAALIGDSETALHGLEQAIEGDPRYHERAKADPVFDCIRADVKALLDGFMQPVQEKVAQARGGSGPLKGYVIPSPEGTQVSSLLQKFRNLEQQLGENNTYRAGLELLETLSRTQQELKNVSDLFRKHYEIDPRDYVRSVTFSPDGSLLASGFLNGGITVWEAETAICAQSLKGHQASVNSVAFSADSQWLASGSRDRTIKLWDVDGRHELKTLYGHTGEVRAVTFSPDCQWLASGSHDRTVRLWRVATGREIQSLFGHTHHVTSTVFSPNGRWIASGSTDRTIKLWEAMTGRVIRTLTGHSHGVASLAFSPDGQWLASGGEDGEVKLWKSSTGRETKSFIGHRNSVTSLAFHPDGQLLAAGSLGQSIVIWRLGTGTILKKLHYRDIGYHTVAFSPRGQWLALGSRDLQLWLKVILTEEEYQAVKAAEERAASATHREDLLYSTWPTARA